MIKIVCWRLSFELLNLLKLLGFQGSEVDYFAYGGNLDPAVLKSRGIVAKSATPFALRDFALRFNHDVPFVGIGMASIERSPESEVQGIVYTISKVDEWILDCYEAHLFLKRYKKGLLEINGRKCYYYHSGRTNESLLPSKAYLQKILNGYKAILPADSPFISQLESQPSLPQMVSRRPPKFLFADYGRFGPVIRPVLEKYDQICVAVFVFFIFRPSVFRRT